MRWIVLICAFAVGCAARPPADAKLTAQGVLDEVKTKGSTATLREYVSGSAQKWQFVLKQIETGDSKWLAVASELRAGSDASHTGDLEFAVAEALTKNPSAVLRLGRFALDRVCDVPYLEPSAKVVREFQTKASAALATVKDADLQERKRKCLAVLMAP